MCSLNEFGNFEFARHLGLTKATPRNFNTVLSPFCLQRAIGIFPALVFVMTFCSDGSGWASLRTGLTGSVKIIKAIGQPPESLVFPDLQPFDINDVAHGKNSVFS